jgi:hypothetical protein
VWLGVAGVTHQLRSLPSPRERESERERERDKERRGDCPRQWAGRKLAALTRQLAAVFVCSCVRVFVWVIGYPGIRVYILIA